METRLRAAAGATVAGEGQTPAYLCLYQCLSTHPHTYTYYCVLYPSVSDTLRPLSSLKVAALVKIHDDNNEVATSAFMVELEVEHKQPKMLFRAMMFK